MTRRRFDCSARLFALPAEVKTAMTFDPWLDIGYQAAGSQQLDASGKPAAHGDTKARACARRRCATGR